MKENEKQMHTFSLNHVLSQSLSLSKTSFMKTNNSNLSYEMKKK